ncbi:MAG: helix-turn-helix domain-containing protein [Acidaminococcaceae bacterium]|jgi:hypothetical protein|nr:helix-turn-helix domain-containing protein [Acidaminococcaceae bacterium]
MVVGIDSVINIHSIDKNLINEYKGIITQCFNKGTYTEKKAKKKKAGYQYYDREKDYQTKKGVAEYFGVSTKTVERMTKQGFFRPSNFLGGRKKRYKTIDILKLGRQKGEEFKPIYSN